MVGEVSSVAPEEVEFVSKWSLWSATPSRSGGNSSWEMKEVFSVENLANFWQHFNCVKSPHEFGNTQIELALFRTGVEPDWEHEPCSLGGRWSARLDRVNSPDSLDQSWLNLLLAAVGETIIENGTNTEVLGVTYSGKGSHSRRISLWMGVRDRDRVLEVGNAFKDVLRTELSDKDIGEMLFHDFESGNKSFAVIANTGKRRPTSGTGSLKLTKSNGGGD